MNRRQFSKASVAAALSAAATSSGQAATRGSYYELRTYELRNDLDTRKIHAAFRENVLPGLKAGSSGPVGCFNVTSGLRSPSLAVLVQYSDLSAIKSNTELAAAGGNWAKFEGDPLPYVRYSSTLLKAFAAHPEIEVPDKQDRSNLFELRTYESKNAVRAAAKIDMFNQEEIKIFRACGIQPVFFGEGIFGERLPHLTYMTAFRDMATRDEAWGKFSNNADWNRIRNDARWLDTVSVIHVSFLSPTDYSDLR